MSEMRKIVIVSTVGLIYDGITSVISSYLEAMDKTDLEIYVVSTIKAEPNIEEKIEKLEKVLDMIQFKCWYYEQALADGNEDRLKTYTETPQD